MDTEATFFIRLHGKARGPLVIGQLRELVSSGAITPDSEAATSPEGPWAQIQTMPMRLMLFSQGTTSPVSSFERVNRNSTPPIDHHAMIMAANQPLLAGLASATTPRPPDMPAHGVHAILKLNLDKAKELGLNELTPMPRRVSRRKHDYYVLLCGIGALIFTVLVAEAVFAVSLQTLAARMPEQFWPMLWQVLFHTPIMAWGVAAFCFYWVALTWLMFFVMDDY